MWMCAVLISSGVASTANHTASILIPHFDQGHDEDLEGLSEPS